MAEYLGNRPRDHRVKYYALVNGSKTYTTNGQRECARRRGDRAGMKYAHPTPALIAA
jgi:hypothetical protein